MKTGFQDIGIHYARRFFHQADEFLSGHVSKGVLGVDNRGQLGIGGGGDDGIVEAHDRDFFGNLNLCLVEGAHSLQSGLVIEVVDGGNVLFADKPGQVLL